MTSVDRRSMYSNSTLVGGGEEGIQDRSRNGQPLTVHDGDQSAIQEIGAYQFQPFVSTSNRDSLSSLQSDTTTLYAQPRSGSSSRPIPPRPLAPTSTTPRIAVHGVETDAQYGLRIPWWSAMMPSPILNRQRSTGKMRITASSSHDRAQQSLASTSSSQSDALDSPSHVGSSHPTLQAEKPSTSPIPPPLPSDYPLYAKCYCEENAYLLAAYLSRTCHQWNKYESTATKGTLMRWSVDVVVVSNKNQTVALWEQQAGISASDHFQVVWDYHVFVVVSCQKRVKAAQGGESTSRQSRQMFSRANTLDNVTKSEGSPTSWVYDLDSRLSSPVQLTRYLSATFGIDNGSIATLNKRFQPLFRVISANDYFVRFGSDRSHMKVVSTSQGTGDASEWLQPRPEWDIISGRKALHSNNYFMDSFVDMRVRIGDGRFGVIIKLEELYKGQGLMSGKEDYQEDVLAAGVATLLDNVGGTHKLQQYQEVGYSQDSNMIPLEEDEVERTPGVMIGGVNRLGIRPPPPPPDGAVISTNNRGKRIMDPLYPAYIVKAYEHRMQEDEANISIS